MVKKGFVLVLTIMLLVSDTSWLSGCNKLAALATNLTESDTDMSNTDISNTEYRLRFTDGTDLEDAETGDFSKEDTGTSDTGTSTSDTSASVAQDNGISDTQIPDPSSAVTPVEMSTEAVTEASTELVNPVSMVENPQEDYSAYSCNVSKLHATMKSSTRLQLAWKSDAAEGSHEYQILRKVSGGKWHIISACSDTSYTDTLKEDGKTYYYKVQAVNVTTGRKISTTKSVRVINSDIVSTDHQRYTYNEMKDDLKQLEEKYSDYCHVSKIGQSVNGRNIYDLTIGNEDAGESLLVVATLHAREYVCSQLVMAQAEYYLKNYNKKIKEISPSSVFNKCALHIIVMANPDGVTISQSKDSQKKSNANGVDLNRNFDCAFKVMGKRGPAGYSGSEAESEPETQAVVKLTKSLKKDTKLRGVVNYHSTGSIVFGSTSKQYTDTVNRVTGKMYNLARRITGYNSSNGYSGVSNGNYREWVMGKMDLPSITIEVGQKAAPVSHWEWPSIWRHNYSLVLEIADLIS